MEKPEKEYGKLSLEQFKQLVNGLPEIRGQMQEVPKLIQSASKEKINEVLDKGYFWAYVYEMLFNEHLAWLICALDRKDKLHEAAQSNDPTQTTIDMFQHDELDDWDALLAASCSALVERCA